MSLEQRAAPAIVGAPRRRSFALVILAAIAFWLVAGFIRAPGFGAQALAASYPDNRVDAIQTTTLPAIPPLFVVQVKGEVYLGQRMWYSSAQLFLVEPVSGWTLSLSGADVAPTAWGPPGT